MTNETSSTSANEHLQAIRVDVDLIRHALPPEAPDDEWPINDTMCDSILTHAAAMAQQLADVQEVCRNLSEAEREYEAEHGAMAAQIERLQEALRVAAALADMRGKQISPYYPSVLCGQGQSELGLQPGDMPDLPNNDGSNGR